MPLLDLAKESSHKQALIMANFSEGTKPFEIPVEVYGRDIELVLSTTQHSSTHELGPLEGKPFKVR